MIFLETYLVRLCWCALIVIVVFGGCSKEKKIIVGSKNFTEQIILGELIAQHLERSTDVEIDRRLNLGGTFVCHEGITAGQLDIYVEYTGTALTAILKETQLSDQGTTLDAVRLAYGDKFGIEWTEPLGFSNSFAVVVRGVDARALRLKTISDAVPHSIDWRAGFGYEFIEREDGYRGLAEIYGLNFLSTPRVMDLGLTYHALAEGEIDFIAGNSTDGMIDALDLVMLDDDLHYFPPYDAVPLIRSEIAVSYPEVREALRVLGNQVTELDMRRMNYSVDGKRKDFRLVVQEFLDGKSL